MVQAERQRIKNAWEGRISGCMLGKPMEQFSMRRGQQELTAYLREAEALPLRDYVPAVPGSSVEKVGLACCKGHIVRSEPDDDINYSVLALMLLEKHGHELSVEDVARAWLNLLPAGAVWTAERATYRTLLNRVGDLFVRGQPAGFDVTECADNEFNDWIGAQIRADVYGWVTPCRPALAAELARRDASLSHVEDGIYGAVFVAAMGAAIPLTRSLPDAAKVALAEIPGGSRAAEAVRFGTELVGDAAAVEKLHKQYGGLSPVHTINNLALVAWALLSNPDDFSAAIGDSVAAGWDTDCNGATVGGLWGLQGKPIPELWTEPWAGRVGVSLAGFAELDLDDLVDRTVAVAATL